MSNVNLYASREGALYQSYDNFAGVQGFYDPSQEAPAQPASTGSAAMMAPAGAPQQYQQQTFAQYYQEQAYQPVAYQPAVAAYPQYLAATTGYSTAPMVSAYSAAPLVQPVQYGIGTVQVVNTPGMRPAVDYAAPLSAPVPRAAPTGPPVTYGEQIRGVGIKFGERIDPRSGGMLVYVKRLVKGGPADQCNRIQPGDVLQIINGEDIYGQGLDILRDKIPGPAGTMVKLGFRSYAGQLYEVDLARTAYGDQPPEAAQPTAPAPQAYPQYAAPVPHQQYEYVAQVPQQPQQYFVPAPALQYMPRPAVQYVPPAAPVSYLPQAQYVAAPRQQVQYQYNQQPVGYIQQPQVQYQQPQYAQPTQPQYAQPTQPQYAQQAQPQYAQPTQRQYQPVEYAQPQYQQYQQPYATQYAQPVAQQQPAYGDYGQKQQQPAYGDYGQMDQQVGQQGGYSPNHGAAPQGGWDDYGSDHLQGTQV